MNKTRFPDMSSLVAYGHQKGLLMGWYGNNCNCRETRYPGDPTLVYRGDVKFLTQSKFEGYKLDNW